MYIRTYVMSRDCTKIGNAGLAPRAEPGPSLNTLGIAVRANDIIFLGCCVLAENCSFLGWVSIN